MTDPIDVADFQARLADLPDSVKELVHNATAPTRRWVLAVFAHQKAARGFIPSVVFEGESGHYPLAGKGELSEPWYFSDDFETAQRLCDEANAERGLTPADVKTIIDSSILASIREDGARQKLRDLGINHPV